METIYKKKISISAVNLNIPVWPLLQNSNIRKSFLIGLLHIEIILNHYSKYQVLTFWSFWDVPSDGERVVFGFYILCRYNRTCLNWLINVNPKLWQLETWYFGSTFVPPCNGALRKNFSKRGAHSRILRFMMEIKNLYCL